MDKDGILGKILMAVFGVGILAGVMVFAIGSSQSNQQTNVTIVIWGTIPRQSMAAALGYMDQVNKDVKTLYIQKNEDTFHEELVDALASGFGPDVIVYPSRFLGRFLDKVFMIPYAQYPANAFQSQYVDAGAIALTGNGIAAFPLAVDPMVMYFNRDILVNNFLARPPQYWDETLEFSKSVTRRNGLDVTQSAIALGSLGNISHAKNIFALIAMQAGNNITDKSQGKLISVLSNPGTGIIPPVESALSFFLQFSNTQSDVYTWNSGLPRSSDMFLAGNLALYFGLGSEVQTLRQRNPNLNFDVAMVPQLRSASRQKTIADMYLISTTKVSYNQGMAQKILFQILDPLIHQPLVVGLGYQSARRDVLVNRVDDPLRTILQNSAMISSAWIDPIPDQTNSIFQKMINSVVSGAQTVSSSVFIAHDEMQRLIDSRIRQF
jgi:ABC-type glycerol-3-phosphate transport system substrate-binding protein